MPHTGSTPVVLLSNADDFREWLKVVADVLGVQAGTISTGAKVGTNTVKKFLKHETRELHLTTAARIKDHVLARAAGLGVDIPPCPLPSANGSEVRK